MHFEDPLYSSSMIIVLGIHHWVNCWFLGKITDETVAFIKTNTPLGGSPEDKVQVYTLGVGSL